MFVPKFNIINIHSLKKLCLERPCKDIIR